MYLDTQQIGQDLFISYYNKDGDKKFKCHRLTKDEMFNWEICESYDKNADPFVLNWDGGAVKKKGTRYLNKYRVTEIIDKLPREDLLDIFEYNLPKTYFVDIEVESNENNDFPHPEEAKFRVTSIAISTPDRRIIVFGLKPLSNEEQDQIDKRIANHFKIDPEHWDFLATFLVFLGRMPDELPQYGLKLSDMELDSYIMCVLREI